MGQLLEFINNHPLLAVAVLASLFAVAFYELRMKAQGLTNVSATMAVRLINKGATILDVRKPDDFGAGHIANARNVELDAIEANPDVINKPKSKILLTVCDNGAASGRAANALRKAGFDSVFSIKGGLAAWRTENLPVVK